MSSSTWFNCTDGWGNWERDAEEDPSRVGCMEEDNESSVQQKSAIKAEGQVVHMRPAMLYDMEVVTVTKWQESKMEVAKMKMLRFSLGKARMDKIRNEDIRKTMGVDKLDKKLRETRLRWLGHVVRREEGYVRRRMRKFVGSTTAFLGSLIIIIRVFFVTPNFLIFAHYIKLVCAITFETVR